MKELLSTNNNFLTKANTGRRLSADIQGSIGQNSGHLALMFLFSRQKRLRLKRQKLTLSEVLTINPLSNMCGGRIIE